MANILIVESKNDKIFIEKLIEILNLNNIQVDEPICEIKDSISIDKYECLNGLDQNLMVRTLGNLSKEILKNDVTKVGIIIDQDLKTKKERLGFINDCVNKVFEASTSLDDINQLITVTTKDNISLQLGCYFTNVAGQGELETLLKNLTTQPSLHADCLDQWRNCVETEKIIISDKDFNKFWLSIYLRYDTCSPDEATQAGRKCTMSAFDYVLREKSHIFDFDSLLLDDLKDFLRLFKD
ncbi:MAG: DUF3226 domain-containing protein [Snowella sp.]|nr:DUF3226 domain-containing protein [Snowella sp.]